MSVRLLNQPDGADPVGSQVVDIGGANLPTRCGTRERANLIGVARAVDHRPKQVAQVEQVREFHDPAVAAADEVRGPDGSRSLVSPEKLGVFPEPDGRLALGCGA